MDTGKTTLLKRILVNCEHLKAAVTVNDMSEIDEDASLVREGGFQEQKKK
jgi:G3E family GTPase